MTPWKQRLLHGLEPVLHERDPRPKLSAYHDLPFGIFVYPPSDEFAVREQVALLATRLERSGKRVHAISLADCLAEALAAEGLEDAALAEAERASGLDLTIETVFGAITGDDYQPLDRVVARRYPADADPLRDIVLLERAGALYPLYRTSALLEQLKGQVRVPTVLLYPGATEGPTGLRFMDLLAAEHNYRPNIF
jgi:hypothetical protein